MNTKTSHSDNHVIRIIGHVPGRDEPVLGWSQHWSDFPVGTKFYTPSPKREWQDLTEEEIIECWPGLAVNKHTYPFARAIEAMLKEKNQC